MSKMPGTKSVKKGADSEGEIKIARGKYRFASDGGVVGTIDILGDTIPSGAYILGGFLEIVNALTSGGAATGAIQIEGANDVVNAAAYSGAPWSSAGRKSIIPAFTGATALKLTAARAISFVIGTANLTAGDFDVVVFYVEPLA